MPSDWQSDPQGFLSGIVGPLRVTSGLRSAAHNLTVGGVPNSAHLTGQAFDFVPQGGDMKGAAARLAQSGVPFDQIINEGDHVHVSFAPTNRHQVLGQSPVSQPGQISDDDLLKALTGGKPSSAASSPSGGNSSDISDEAILKALTGPAPKAASPSAAKATEPSKPAPSPVVDAIRSIPGGLAKGAAAIAGLPGDIQDLQTKGLGGVMKLLGADPGTVDKSNALMAQHQTLPTSETINQNISKPFGGYYEPQTRAGKFVDTISQFAPAAAAPGSALMRAARVVIPGAASEAAGEATEGKPYEGAARLTGALVGAGGLGAAKQLAENAAVAKTILSTAEIKQAANAAYKRAEEAGVVIKSSEVQNLGKTIAQDVEQAGIDTTLHPKATAALKRITDSKGDVSLKQMDILRRVANGAAGSMDKDESRIAHIILDHIDDFVENLSPSSTVSGNTADAAAAIKEARGLWAKQAKSSVIDNLMERAKNRAETIGGSGLENAVRVEFRQLAQNPNRLRGFSQDEREAIMQVARGGKIENASRLLGKVAPTNAINILAAIGGAAYDPVSLAIPAAGMVGRSAATAMTLNNAAKASKIIRGGTGSVPKQVFTPELLSALLARKRDEDSSSGNALVPSYSK